MTLNRNAALRGLLLALAPLALAASAHAAPVQPFTAKAFDAARRAGQPVLVDVHADWCPTCKAQAPTIAAISRDPAYAKLVILKLDFDGQKAERKALGVNKQSTLIAFHGTAERGRATGVTDPAGIRYIAAAALK